MARPWGVERLFNISGDEDPSKGFPVMIDFNGESYIIQPRGFRFRRVEDPQKNSTSKYHFEKIVSPKTGQPIPNDVNWIDCTPAQAQWFLDGRNADKARGVLVRGEAIGATISNEIDELRSKRKDEEESLLAMRAEAAEMEKRIAALRKQEEKAAKPSKEGAGTRV